MRVFGSCLFGVSVLLTSVAARQSAPPDATALLAAAREAIGGEARLSAVRTFIATGRTRKIEGDNLVPVEFEASCELPDRCVRIDEIPARQSGPTTIGFAGDVLIERPGGQGQRGGDDAARRTRLLGVKQEFARLTLGMFLASFASYPLTFSYAGEAEAPQGRADVIGVAGRADFAARLFVYKETHLPIMLSWREQAETGPVEHRLYYADHRDADGLKLPFRIRRAVGSDTTEETTFDRYRINARIDARRFEAD